MIQHAPSLTSEQADLADVVGALVADAGECLSDARVHQVATIRRRLAGLGLWTLGVSTDGDGASDELAAVVFACLGRKWPALGWASVQAHAAVEVLGDVALSADVRGGDTAVAVVDEVSTVVRLTMSRGWLAGRIERIDPAGELPYVVVLRQDSAWLIPPQALRFERLRRTGLAGGLTTSAEVVKPLRAADVTITGVDAEAARTRLRLGAAAVAAGIAEAAAQAALAYSAQREQFGAPLIDLPTVRDALFSSSAAVVTALRQVLRPRDCPAWQAAAVLDTACEQAIDTCAHAVQAHGGYGYLTDYEVERMLRDAVSLRAACDVLTARRQGAEHLARISAARSRSGYPS